MSRRILAVLQDALQTNFEIGHAVPQDAQLLLIRGKLIDLVDVSIQAHHLDSTFYQNIDKDHKQLVCIDH